MQSDDLGHGPRLPVTKVTLHRVPNHFPQLLHRVPLSGDGMPQRNSAKATVGVFRDLKDNF